MKKNYDSYHGFPDFFYAEIWIFGFLYWSFKVSLAYAIFYFFFAFENAKSRFGLKKWLDD